jgi:hypothetical protein
LLVPRRNCRGRPTIRQRSHSSDACQTKPDGEVANEEQMVLHTDTCSGLVRSFMGLTGILDTGVSR